MTNTIEAQSNTFEIKNCRRITFVESIGARVKAVRQELGWSQVQLAEEVGVSQSSIGNIESGFRQRPRDLVAIAKALRVSPEWLESGKGPRTPRVALRLVEEDGKPSARELVEQLAALAVKQRPTLRRNLANLLVEVVEHPEDADLLEQAIKDVERFYGSST